MPPAPAHPSSLLNIQGKEELPHLKQAGKQDKKWPWPMFRNKGQSPDSAGMVGNGVEQANQRRWWEDLRRSTGTQQLAPGCPAEGMFRVRCSALCSCWLGAESSYTKGMSRDAMAIRLVPFSASRASIVDVGSQGAGAEKIPARYEVMRGRTPTAKGRRCGNDPRTPWARMGDRFSIESMCLCVADKMKRPPSRTDRPIFHHSRLGIVGFQGLSSNGIGSSTYVP